MAKQAEKRGLPPQLPVMAALVESGLKNLNYGDADSVGFFQMRTSIWNQGDYAGYDKDPRKQVDWFLDTAESVKAQRQARGQSVTDPEPVRRMDRRRRTPRRPIPRPLPTPTRRSQQPPQQRPTAGRTRGRRSGAGAAAPAAPPVEPEKRAPIDADQFGQEGTGSGGKPDAEMRAILENKNVTFDSVGVADIKAGRIDPRIIGVLTKLSQDHKIVVSCMCSDHPRMTTSGFVSNHTYGRGLDIASIDGEIVSPGSAAAREVSSGAQRLRSGDPAGRDRVAVRDQRPRLLHRRRPPEPRARRVQDRDQPGLETPARTRRGRPHRRARGARGRARRRRCRAGRRNPPRRRRPTPNATPGCSPRSRPPPSRARSPPPAAARPAATPGCSPRSTPRPRRPRNPPRSPPHPPPPPPPNRPPPAPSTSAAPPTPTPATTPARNSSPPGWPSKPRNAASRRSSPSWPRSSSPA